MLNFIIHRVNTVEELKMIPHEYGVEIDLRWNADKIVLSHDPCQSSENYDDIESYLKNYKHSMLILNLKETGFEGILVDILKRYNVKNYFFLDLQFPVVVKLLKQGNSNFAVRLSEYENLKSIDSLLVLPKYVWVDCFTKYPESNVINDIRTRGMRICFVSPELQNHSFEKVKDLHLNEDDYICCKLGTIQKWLSK